MDVHATDELSGVAAIFVQFSSAHGQRVSGWATTESGSPQDGEWTATVTFPRYSEQGAWQLQLDPWDAIGNHRTYTPAELFALGLLSGINDVGFESDQAAALYSWISPPSRSPPVHSGARRRPRQGRDVGPIWRRKAQSSMRSMPVVVIDEDTENVFEMWAVGDQQPVEALSAHGADEALGDGVGDRRSDGGPDDLDALAAEDLIEGARELGVVVAEQEAQWTLAFLQTPGEVSRLLDDPGSIGVLGHAGEVDAAA